MNPTEIPPDPYWASLVQWIHEKSPTAPVYAPELLAPLLKNRVVPYPEGKLDPSIRFAALHKGQLDEIGSANLKQILREFKPVHANEVFVFYDRHPASPGQVLDPSHEHFVPFLEQLVDLDPHARPAPVYLGDHLALTRLANGLDCYVDTRDQAFAPDLLLRGIAHDYIVPYFQKQVRPGDVVLDLGANMGYFTLLFGAAVGDRGKVIAFEPHPKLATLIFQNAELNKFRDRTIVVNKAVADRCGRQVLHCFGKYQGSSTLGVVSPDYARSFHDELESIEVDTVTLDSYFRENPTRLDVIKLDIQGYEPQALRGAEKILQQQERLLLFCEFAPSELTLSGNSPPEFLQYLNTLGFTRQVLDLSGHLSQKTDSEILQMSHHTHVDFILTKGREKVTAP